MRLEIHKTAGLRNDLVVELPRQEIACVLFHIANRSRLMALPGLVRHAPQDPAERAAVGACKVAVEEHLAALRSGGAPLVGDDGRPLRRVLAVGCRNVGNNHGFVAWQRGEEPPFFHVRGDPLGLPAYSCLVRHLDGALAIRQLGFAGGGVLDGEREVTAEIDWCVFANQVLRDGRVIAVEEIIEQFYDIRHVLGFDEASGLGKEVAREVYRDYPQGFRENALRALLERGVPRQRFLHGCLGLAEDSLLLLQREGTVEEVAQWMRELGCRDGVILDNGASPFLWAWWPYPRGGFLFTAPDYRPQASAVLAFVLRGPARTELPGGSVGYTVV